MAIDKDLFYANVLEKAASVISDQEKTIAELQAKIESLNDSLYQTKMASLNPVVQELRSKGFSDEEALGMAKSLPEATLNKVASIGGAAGSWEIGSVSDLPAKGSDPIMDFILS